jgi:lipopolysaccharide/colanic/teichoic acid biosynthesis glycosyltransferase
MTEMSLKRVQDVTVAIVMLVVAAPLLIVAMTAIWLTDRGPVLYAHERVGRDGRRIRVWKLRTMVRNGDAALARHLALNSAAYEEWTTYFRLREDPRIIGRTGTLLRRYSIDELPQFWNVLRGDLSLVGPRPLPDSVCSALPADFVARRTAVRPGLTGLWQVNGRSDGDMEALIRFDDAYLQTGGARMDLRILLATPLAVLLAVGAY